MLCRYSYNIHNSLDFFDFFKSFFIYYVNVCSHCPFKLLRKRAAKATYKQNNNKNNNNKKSFPPRTNLSERFSLICVCMLIHQRYTIRRAADRLKDRLSQDEKAHETMAFYESLFSPSDRPYWRTADTRMPKGAVPVTVSH